MNNSYNILQGVVHKIPSDMKTILLNNPALFLIWQSLTTLARNEWICWTISVKKEETRQEHIRRMVDQLKKGKRRPCCWAGCVHRIK